MPPPSERDARPSVLVVDDDRTVRLWAQQWFGKAGFRVLEAGDGLQSLEIFAEHRPDLVMLDVNMPRLDGYATCARLRQLPGGRIVPILMVTGLDDLASIDRAFEVGATDFATKPINWALLQHRLRYLLRNSRLTETLADQQTDLANAQRIAKLGNWHWHLATDRVRGSDQLYRLLGAEPGAIPPRLQSILQITREADRAPLKTAVIETLKTGRATAVNVHITPPGGDERVVHQITQAYRDEQGHIVSLQGTLQDVTERQLAEEKIHRLAYFDSLTGLPNRHSFVTRAAEVIALAKQRGRTPAVLFVDLDNFKRVNDTLGYKVGDRFLRAAADRLGAALRRGGPGADRDGRAETGQIARFGADEFIVLVPDAARPEDADRVARRLLDALSRPLTVAGHTVSITASIGVSVFTADGEDVDALLKNADAAMCHAKQTGKNAYQFFDASMNEAAIHRLSLENALQQALSRNEFRLVHQPQLDLTSGAIVGVETLLRWHNPQFGWVSPATFIPLAEETGQIVDIGAWVLKTACAQARGWQRQGLPPVRVAVNLSARQFCQPNLLEQVCEILAETGFSADRLELEITESLLMQNVEQAIETMSALKCLGVQLAIDDFGTGYSSLSYLQRFPIDRLKIDQSFVREITTQPGSAAIAQAVVSMAHSLRLEVIAEGVETESQLAFLKQNRCDEVQGYYVSRPLPPEQVAALLSAQAGADAGRVSQQTRATRAEEPRVCERAVGGFGPTG